MFSNPAQIEAFARQILPIVGTLLAVFGMKSATANAIVDTLMAIVGPITVIVSAVWSLIANTKSSVIAKAAALPEVDKVKLTSDAPATLVESTPNNVTK